MSSSSSSITTIGKGWLAFGDAIVNICVTCISKEKKGNKGIKLQQQHEKNEREYLF